MKKFMIGLLIAAAAVIIGVIVGKSFHDEILDNDDFDDDDDDDFELFCNNEGEVDIDVPVIEREDFDTTIIRS
jgi:hypothetical protein